MSEMDAVLELKGLAKHVRTRVPKSLAPLSVCELEELDLAAALQRARCVVVHPALAYL